MPTLCPRVALSALLLTTALAGPAALAQVNPVQAKGYGAQERAAVDFRTKRVADPRVLQSLFQTYRGVPYFRHLRKSGHVTPRRLWRRKRLGRPVVTQDTPPALRELEQWKQKR